MTIKYVYVAGPLTKGDVGANIREAMHVAAFMLKEGFAPFLPHASFFWDMVEPAQYERWLAYDFAWIERCDALLRLPGESPGGDREVEHAKEHGVIVFGSANTHVSDALRALLDGRTKETHAEAYKRAVESEMVQQNAVLKWVSDALDGNAVSDFAESYPVVYHARAAGLLAKRAPELREQALAYRKALLASNAQRRALLAKEH